jgi:DNA-binding LacI/PurR family transcriptional regulator
LTGFREHLAQNNVKSPVVVYANEYSHAAGKATAVELLRKHPQIDGLFCADDLLGIGALDAIRSILRRAVPKDIGVIGFDDIQMASWDAYQLSTLRTHLDQVIVHAIER